MSPTFQVVLAAGVSITAVGGVLPAEIVTADVPVAPDGSVTRRVAVRVPGCVYVKLAVAEVASSNAPSPSRSHA